MTRSLFPLVAALCFGAAPLLQAEESGLVAARKGHTTKLTRKTKDGETLEAPESPLFSLARYKAPLGTMSAYVSKPEKPGVKYPAMLWITGGFPTGGIGPSAWDEVGSENDQSAKAYRQAGMIMMYPTVRGSYTNPGTQESFYGEVDDVLAAADYLASLDYVDPKRIYLGGHSTGGTLALLVAQASPRFRAVISFGPVSDPAVYGSEVLSYDPSDAKEAKLRAPIHYLDDLETPTFVIEGSVRGNLDSLLELKKASKNPKLHCVGVEGATHFDILYPVNRLIARKIAALEGDAELSLSAAEIKGAFTNHRDAMFEAEQLSMLARARSVGAPLDAPSTTVHYFFARTSGGLSLLAKGAKALGHAPQDLVKRMDSRGQPFFMLTVEVELTLGKLDALFASSRALAKLAAKHEAQYEGWEPK